MAAAAVLPLSDQPLPEGMHQGTRHRAALGISEQSDSLALVVSEETGYISVAQNGRLKRGLDATELRDTLYRFYVPLQASSTGLRGLLQARIRVPGRGGEVSRRTRIMQILRFLATAALAVLLAIATWLLVAEQVNPAKTEVMAGNPAACGQPGQGSAACERTARHSLRGSAGAARYHGESVASELSRTD